MADIRLLRLSKVELAAVAAICTLAVIPRLMLINRPIEYDEAYTVMAFAHSPFRVLVSDYHLPNNHVFHTILVRIAVLLLGSQPWQIRMPAFLAGMLLILFVFWLARALYTRDEGFLAAAIVAFLPAMVGRSVSARGYIIVTLLAVMAFLLACYLVRHRNLFGWSLLAIVCALGFYAVPIMLFPFGFLFLWMLMSTPHLGHDQYSRSAWHMHLATAAVMVALLTLLFYFPILLSTELDLIFPSSGMLHSQSMLSLLQSLPGLMSSVLAEWTGGLGPVWQGVFLLGLLLSLFSIRDRRNHRVHTAAAFVPAVFILLLIQRPNPVGRIWLWVVPFAAIWISAGLGIFIRTMRRNKVGRGISSILLVSFLVGLAATGIQSSAQQVMANDFELPAAREAARVLAPRLTPGSVLVVDYGSDAYLWYYLYLEGVERSPIFRQARSRPFDEVFAVTVTGAASCHNRDLLATLDRVGPDLALLNLDEMRKVAHIDSLMICWIPSLTP